MPVITVGMAVRHLIGRSRAHVEHFQSHAQVESGPRVVGVQNDFVTLDFHHIENLIAPIGCAAAQLPTHFDARRELCFGNGLNQALVAFAKGIGIGSGQLQGDGKANILALQRFSILGKVLS